MNIWMDLFYTFSQVWFVDCLCWFVFTGATMCVLVWNDFFTTGFTLIPKSRFVVFLYAVNLSCLCSFQTITIPLIRMKNRLFTSMSGYDRYCKSEIWYCTVILWRSKWNGSHHRPKKHPNKCWFYAAVYFGADSGISHNFKNQQCNEGKVELAVI